MWQKSSQALRDKFEREHKKAKTKYLADLVKYDEKVKKQQIVEEKKKSKGRFLLSFNRHFMCINYHNPNHSHALGFKAKSRGFGQL